MGKKYFLFAITIFYFFCSCNIEKRIERQQEKFDNIGRKWLKLHPCDKDSFVVYIPGKRDSVLIKVPVIIADTNYTKKQLDSLQQELRKKYLKATENCTDEISQAYTLGYNNATKIWKDKVGQIKVPIPIVDTLRITLKDKQAIQLLQDDLATSRKKVQDLTVENLTNIGKKDKWFLWFVITAILLLGSIILKFKK
jgi:hypothetical protein